KIDLTQAEAVAEIVSAANTGQLAAAERLLHGRFSDTIGIIRERIVDLMGHLEAGLDFSEEDIEFISKDDALVQIHRLKSELTDLLEGSIRCERMIDLDSVGLAGVPNAGKSSLLNALLGTQRSIVSDTEATTRDVLTGVLSLDQLDCVLFDCAGLLAEDKQTELVDQLSHQASLTALNTAAVVMFCVDLSRSDITADLQMHQQIDSSSVIFIATKSDCLDQSIVAKNLHKLSQAFGNEFLLTSTQTGQGLGALKSRIQEALIALRAGDAEHADRLTINQRHQQRLTEAVKTLGESADEITGDSAEIAVMLLRQTYELLGTLERENVSETVLDRIFSQFCIGK
ncbi:MAG: GTPase, partial [Planctomycetota bacterium]